MSAVHEVFNLSRDFLEEISKPAPKNERDHLILKIKEFLAKREILLKDMNGPYSPGEQQIGRQMIEYDQKIQEVLESIKQEIQRDFLAAKNKKRHTPKYINPYINIFTEGAYVDKKN